MGETFSNQLPEKLEEEKDFANAIGVEPIRADHPGFSELVDSGEPLIWAIDVQGNLVFSLGTINHSVLVDGGPVISAGEVNLVSDGQGGYVIVDINNRSGHYQPSEESLEIAVEIFKSYGIRDSF